MALFKDEYNLTNIPSIRIALNDIIKAINTTQELYPTLPIESQWRLLLELKTGLVEMYYNDDNNIINDFGAHNQFFPYTISLDETLIIDDVESYIKNPIKYFKELDMKVPLDSEIFKFSDLDGLKTYFEDIQLKYEFLYQSNVLNSDGDVDNGKMFIKFGSIEDTSRYMSDMLVSVSSNELIERYNDTMNDLYDKVFNFKLKVGGLPDFIKTPEDIINLITRAKEFENGLPKEFKDIAMGNGETIVPKTMNDLRKTNYIIPFMENSLHLTDISKDVEIEKSR